MALMRQTACALVFTTLAGMALAAHRQEAKATGEQRSFGNVPERHPVSPPSAVVKLLLQTEEVKQVLPFATDSEREHPAQLFRAAEVHLGPSNETDLVVMGNPPICGADNDWFWIVLSARKHPRIVLFAGTDMLSVLERRTQGYKNVRTSWSSPSETDLTIYRFDGKVYRVWKDKRTHNPR